MEIVDEGEVVAEYVRRFTRSDIFDSLENLLTSGLGFGLETATPLQRAICRLADGADLGDLAGVETIQRALGCNRQALEKLQGPPSELVVLSGIRTAKSLTAAALAVRASQTCDVSKMGAGEVPRVSVVSLTRDLANVTFRHIAGNLQASEQLSHLLIDDPTSDSVLLRHPTGRPVEIKVVAGARAGASLVARWSAGCIFDEAPRMVGADDGVVNFDDARSAVIGRLLPGAQIVAIGSPWAPYGPIFDLVTRHWGNPSSQLVVIKAPGPDLNPYWWTEERIAELKASDPTAYQTDVLAEFADPAESLFPSTIVQACTRLEPTLPYNSRNDYSPAMDPATRGDSWSLIISTKEGVKKRVAFNQCWQGSKVDPLRPRAVLAEVAACCRTYGLNYVYTDQWAADALRDIAEEFGLLLLVEEWTKKNKLEQFQNLATEMANGNVELPPDPLLAKDLKVIKKRVTQDGYAIQLPRTPDGRHADYGPSLARSLAKWINQPEKERPKRGTREYQEYEAEQMLEEELETFQNESSQEWWTQVPS